MFQSIRHSQLVVRLGIAAVFLWFGIDKFIEPQYWVDAWMPQSIQQGIGYIHMAPADAMFLLGIFEVLVALSLVTGFFLRWFATLAAVFLIATLGFQGLNEGTVRDLAIIGGLVSLVIWPERSYV
jgi:uncharacterized membrane protein YphA (DoxX/SURF4 family)